MTLKVYRLVQDESELLGCIDKNKENDLMLSCKIQTLNGLNLLGKGVEKWKVYMENNEKQESISKNERIVEVSDKKEPNKDDNYFPLAKTSQEGHLVQESEKESAYLGGIEPNVISVEMATIASLFPEYTKILFGPLMIKTVYENDEKGFQLYEKLPDFEIRLREYTHVGNVKMKDGKAEISGEIRKWDYTRPFTNAFSDKIRKITEDCASNMKIWTENARKAPKVMEDSLDNYSIKILTRGDGNEFEVYTKPCENAGEILKSRLEHRG